MRLTDAYGDLLQIGRPIVTTKDAGIRWKTKPRTTSHRLKAMEESGLIRHLRPGLWSLDPGVPPFALAPYLTAPYPAYVSFWSALAHHGLIDQIPRRVSVASLGRTQDIETTLGTYEIHQLAPELFGGYYGTDRDGYVATPEKAIFDIVYVRAAAGKKAFFTELYLTRDFDRKALRHWINLIENPRLRTLVARRIREVLRARSR
jgi:predicted transcriptional regulator of viral defense system